MQFIDVIDTTFRDGQQSPLLFDTQKYRFTLAEKQELLKGMLELGVAHFEFFSPIVSPIEKADTKHLMSYGRKIQKHAQFLAHCRLKEEDIREALTHGFDGCNVYIGTSAHAQAHSHHMDIAAIVKRTKTILSDIRSTYPHTYIRFSAEDAFRSGVDDLYAVYDAAAPYVDTLGIPDTVGIATPNTVSKVVKKIRARYPTHKIECHFHNDRGLAVANSLEAVSSGVHFVDTSIWGLAERSGIPSLTAILINLFLEYPKLTSRYQIAQSYPLNVLMGSILEAQVPYSEPISLTNRTHTAGVHQKAVIANEKVYEAHHLEQWGVTRNALLLGPLSGSNLIHYYLREVGNFEIDKVVATDITKEFKQSVTLMNKTNSPEQVLFTIARKRGYTPISVPAQFARKRFENLGN